MAKEFTNTSLDLEYEFNVPVDKAWRAFAEETTAWWTKDFFAMPTSTRMILELEIGGKLYEAGPDGSGVLWATVIMMERGKSIDFAGTLTRMFGGPSTVSNRFEFHDYDGRTKMKLLTDSFGYIDPEGEKQLKEGWDYLFKKMFKQYVEKIEFV